MGLDMYLTGERRIIRRDQQQQLISERFQLGYWRKHPNLHGYIVQQFADGLDQCQEIPLSAGNIRQLLSAIENRQLPLTEGFFFGVSDGTETPHDLAIFTDVLAWLEAEDPAASRSVFYQASW